MGDDKIIDLTKFYHQRGVEGDDDEHEKFFKELEQADFETFKSTVVWLLKSLRIEFGRLEDGIKHIDAQIDAASDNFRYFKKRIDNLDEVVQSLADSVRKIAQR